MYVLAFLFPVTALMELDGDIWGNPSTCANAGNCWRGALALTEAGFAAKGGSLPPLGGVSETEVEMSFLTNEQTQLSRQHRSDLVWARTHNHVTVELSGVCVAAGEQTIPNPAWSHSGADRWHLIWHPACHIKIIHFFWKHSNQCVNLSEINIFCYTTIVILIWFYDWVPLCSQPTASETDFA